MKILVPLLAAWFVLPSPVQGVQARSPAAPTATVDSLLMRGRASLDRGGLAPALLADIGRAVRTTPDPLRAAGLLGVLGRHHVMAGAPAALDTVLDLLTRVGNRDDGVDADRRLLSAERYRLAGNADSSRAHLERALLLREGMRDWAAVAEVYVAYGRVADHLLSDPSGALSYYTQAAAMGRDRAPHATILVHALLESGHVAARLGRTIDALARYREAEMFASRLDLSGLAALALYHHGVVQLERQGRVDAARLDFQRAVRVAEGVGVFSVRARIIAYQRLGDIHYQYGSSHDSALVAYERAIESDDGGPWGPLLIGAYRNAGIIHAWWGRDERARDLLARATLLAAGDDDQDLAESNRGHWITALVRAGDLQGAIRALEPMHAQTVVGGDGTFAVALGAIVQAADQDSVIAFDASSWAEVFETPPTMDAFFRTAVDLALARDDIESLLFALYEYGRSLDAVGRRQEAQRTFRSAWNQAARKGRGDERHALERLIAR